MGPVVPDDACLDALRAELLALPGVREGRMFGVPAFYVGRRLMACVFGDVIGVKVPEATADALIASGGYERFTPYGRPPMRQWVQFGCGPDHPVDRHRDTLLAAYEHVAAIPDA